MYLKYSVEQISKQGSLEPVENFRYFLIIHGEGECSSRHQHFRLNLHDVLAVPQNTELTFHNIGILTVGCIWVFDMLTPRSTIYHLPGEHTTFLRQLFYQAMDIQYVDLPYYDAVRDSMNQLVFASLIAAELASNQLNPTVVQVIRNITDHFTDPEFDLHQIIEQTGYTVNHFRKLFREEAGMPPLEFLNNRRMEYAKELIRRFHGRLSIAEIAHQCGFKDEYYFARYFKKHEGMTPVQYSIQYSSD